MAELGMILRMLVPFPLQKAKKPCSEDTPMKKFSLPRSIFKNLTDEGVENAFIFGLFGVNQSLILKQKFYTLERSNEGFGDRACHETGGDFAKDDGNLISSTFLGINRHVEGMRREV